MPGSSMHDAASSVASTLYESGEKRLLVVDVPFEPPSERGRVHGEKLAATIEALFEAWTGENNGGLVPRCPRAQALAYAAKCWPVIESAAPESAEEIRALAKASGVPLLAIVALNCFDEIGLVDAIETETGEKSYASIGQHGGHCTGAVIGRSDGRTVTGQTWDCPLFYRPVVMLRALDKDGRVLETHLTFAGIIGGPCLTARGLACTWFTVVPKSPRLAGLSSSILLREAARSCSTVKEAVALWGRSPRCAGCAFFAADDAGSIGQWESDARGHDVQLKSGDGAWFAHANNYTAEKFADNDQHAGWDWTECRTARMHELVAGFPVPPADGSDPFPALIKEALADGQGMAKGVSICEHAACTGGKWETLAAVVFEPASGLAWFTRGRPDDPAAPWESFAVARDHASN